MHIALLVFGQFRAYEEVMEKNLQQIQKTFPTSTFDIYILTDKKPEGFYSADAEESIKFLLGKYKVSIKLFAFWEDLTSCHATDAVITEYMKQSGLPWNSDFLGSLWYRRYILWKLFEEQNISYDFCVFNRLFDTDINLLHPLLPLLQETTGPQTLFYAIDTFFIASPPIMKRLLTFGSTAQHFKDFEWSQEFTDAFKHFDYNVATHKHTFCSQTQIFKYIFDSFEYHKNLHADFVHGSPSHTDARFFIKLFRPTHIPKRILQIAIGDEYVKSLPLDVLKGMLVQHNEGYEYSLMTHSDCLQFLRDFFPAYLGLYESLQRPQYKSDLIRYLYLYTFGGYYIDIDILPLLPLREIYAKTGSTTFLCMEGAHTDPEKGVFEMANGFLGARRGNPIFLDLVEQMAKDPNPSDYGMNVKRFYATVKRLDSSLRPCIFKEARDGAAYSIFHNEERVGLSNGHGYPWCVLR